MDSADLFDKVFGNRAVETKWRRLHLQPGAGPLHGEAKAFEDDRGIRKLHRDAQDALDPIPIQLDRDRRQRHGIDISRLRCPTAGQFRDQGRGPLHRRQAQRRAQSFFKPRRGFGPQSVHSCRPADRSWLPGGGLQEDVGRRHLDGALRAADDPREPLRSHGVGHNHVLRGQSARLPVEARQFLAVTSAPDDDPPAFESLVIEGMHRLPALEHYVVRDVDDVADRPDAGGPEPCLHPGRRWRNGDSSDQAPHEPAATIGRVDSDQVGDIAPAALRDRRLVDRQVENGAHLSRDAQMA